MGSRMACGLRATSSSGVEDKNGWYVKANSAGDPLPLNSGLAPLFKQANVRTLPDALRYGADKYSETECMATRKLIARHHQEKDGKMIEMLTLGEYSWSSYREVLETAQAVGCSLNSMNFKCGDRVAIFAETRAEWFTAAMGCLQQRVTVCTLYTNLSNDAIVHAVNETEVNLLFTSFDLLQRICLLLGRCPSLTTIVVMEDQLEGMGDVSSIPTNISVIPFSEISAKDKINSLALKVKPDPEDIAIIMYTSGSTGTPKGVELTHSNIIHSVTAYSCQMNVGLKDRYLAFLPLAHIMELASEISLISLGVTIYYSSPFTLTSSSPKINPGTEGDAKLAKPTVMNAVPLLLDRILKGVSLAVDRQGWLKSAVFNTLLAYKDWLSIIPFVSGFLDRTVFKKVRDELGGELKRVAVGGAPISPQSHNTFRTLFRCSVQVGYGCTETASCAAGMNESNITLGYCGGPCLNVFLRLADWDEGGYRTTDKPFPRGELLIGGPCVAKGYFKLPDETKNTFFEENGQRWFRSGDIAEIDNTGCARIIDRKKDLVKLKHGEYISLGNTESILKTIGVVDNLCIFADSMRSKTVAVVVPVLDVLRTMAANHGIKYPDVTLNELCDEKRMTDAVLKEIQSHGRRCGLSRWEIPAAVHLTDEPWTPDTGLVTAAFKLRRKQLEQQYQAMVLHMYSQLDE